MLATDNQWWTNIIAANQNPYDLRQFSGTTIPILQVARLAAGAGGSIDRLRTLL